ncbi:hypothetical protein ACRAWG_34320 [Methylobacterium sp. P31]
MPKDVRIRRDNFEAEYSEGNMRGAILPVLMLGLLGSGPSFAANDQTQAAAPGQQASASSTGQQQSLVTAQMLNQDLENAGFTDVAILNEAFVVKAKTKSGAPVVTTIGPGGFNMVEAVHPGHVNTTGSTGSGAGKPNRSGPQ